MAYAHQVEALKKRGEPIEWVRTDPVYAYLQEIAVAARAPHPSAARLFVDWLLSAEGQREIAGIGQIPARPGLNSFPATLTEGVRFDYVDPALIADPVQARIEYVALLRVK